MAEIDASSLKTEWFSVDADQNIKLGWTDIHGLQSKEPFHLQLDPVDDNAPSVQARTSLDDRILLEDEVATFDIFAKDDYGIRQVGLEWSNEVEQSTTPSPKGWKPVTAGNPQEREINAKAAFRPKSEGLIPQTIQIRAFAEDYLPGGDPAPTLNLSQSIFSAMRNTPFGYRNNFMNGDVGRLRLMRRNLN